MIQNKTKMSTKLGKLTALQLKTLIVQKFKQSEHKMFQAKWALLYPFSLTFSCTSKKKSNSEHSPSFPLSNTLLTFAHWLIILTSASLFLSPSLSYSLLLYSYKAIECILHKQVKTFFALSFSLILSHSLSLSLSLTSFFDFKKNGQ